MTYSDIPSKRIEPHSRACAKAVVEILHSTLLEGHAADRTLASYLKANHQLGSRDRRIISETLFSVLRWWGWLKFLAPEDFVENLKTGRIPDSIPEITPWFRCLAASWLLEGRPELPPSASWWLFQAKIHAQNIPKLPPDSEILTRRKCLRPFFPDEKDLPPLPMEALVPQWAMPEVKCPFQWDDLIEWLQARPPVWLRAQTNDFDKLIGEFNREEIRLTRHEKMSHALKASFAGVNLRQMPPFQEGRFEIQDAASQAVALVCDPKPGENWWDCCAGAGGKTLHLAWLMKGKGKITATDNRTYKLDDLKLRARRCQLSNIIYKEWLGIEVKRYNGCFHGVLVDAPCSCSGTWRRNPGARWTSKIQDIDELAKLQTQLLANASLGVMPGGTLVYATCSMFQRENQDVAQAFLNTHSDFQLVPFISPLTGNETDGMLQTWPWDSDCDAMFIAKFVRKK